MAVGVNVKYEWDFGDGNTSDEANPEHVYLMPGEYNWTLVTTDEDNNVYYGNGTIYVYENDYLPGGRNVTKSNKIFRFAVPQEKKQGIGWSEYTGDDYPFAVGLTGACKIFNDTDEERLIVTDCDSFKHYWLGKDDHWQDGGNDEYAGSEIESDILLREHAPPIEASAKIRHSESHANFRPWYKDRRNIDDYNQYGFRTPFKTSMYFREDSSPEDRAVVKYFPRKAQIISDRHIESEALQAGLRITGAPWRLPSVQQFFEQIDTGGSPTEKQMSEKTWAELIESPLVWLGRSLELVNPTTGAQTMPWDKGGNQRSTGSFLSVTDGPDGNTRSAVSFAAADSMAVATSIPAGDVSFVLWTRSPTSPCTLVDVDGLTIQLVDTGAGWELQWADAVNAFDVPIATPDANWKMYVLSRHGYVVEIYENGIFLNTRHIDENLGYASPITFFGGAVVAFEPRIIEAHMTADAVKWMYDDVIENQGNSTCAMY